MSQTVSASKLSKALVRAQNVGVVEEPFTLNGVPMVVRNLRPDEHESILADCQGLDDIVYLHRLQKAHVARGLVEVDAVNLRDVTYVEDEGQDDKGRVRKVKLELHQWVFDNILSTWGRESIYSAYRKVNDAMDQAEQKSKEGIHFLIADENDEERVRRLLAEARDGLETLPPGVRQRVLDDNGLVEQSTAAEFKAAQERLDALRRSEEAKAAPVEESEPAPEEDSHEEGPSEQDVDVLRQGLKQVERQPLNRLLEVSDAPVPVSGGRAALLAQEAAEAALSLGLPDDIPRPTPTKDTASGAPVEIRPQVKRSLTDAAAIIDAPPVAGKNPLFRPPFGR